MAKGLTQEDYRTAIARIYNQHSKVVGVGFLVAEGYLLTCAHVVAAAMPGVSDDASDRPEGVLSLDFLSAKNQMLTAKVVVWQPVNPSIPYEDIAGLQLIEEQPQGVKPLHLAGVESYWEHPFASLGFPRKKKAGRWARGILLGEVDDGRWIQIEDEKAQGYAIEEGFSGAPVLDHQAKKCVGMVVARETKNDDAKIGFMIPCRILQPALNHIERLSLGDALHFESSSVSSSELGAAYQFCRPDGWQPQSPLQTIEEQLADVHQMKPGADGVAKLYQFVAYLINPRRNIPSAIQKKLRSWLGSRVENISVLLDDVAQRAEIWHEKNSADCHPHLLVWVRAKRSYRGLYDVKALFIPHAGRYNRASGEGSHQLSAPEQFGEQGVKIRSESLPTLVSACIDEIYREYQLVDDQGLTIEVLLPQLLLLTRPVDQWTGEVESTQVGADDLSSESDDVWEPKPLPTPFGFRYPLVVRSSERLEPFYRQRGYRNKWENKWANLLEHSHIKTEDAIVNGDEISWKKLCADFRKAHVIGLKFLQGPPSTKRGSPFELLFLEGVPTALWLRETLGRNGDVVVNGLLGCQLCQLPVTVQEQRIAAFGQEEDFLLDDSHDSSQNDDEQLAEHQHIGHHLSLLWENPHLVFPPLSTQENQPIQSSTSS